MFEAINLHATYIYIDVYPEFIEESEKSEGNHALEVSKPRRIPAEEKELADVKLIAEECGPKMELLK